VKIRSVDRGNIESAVNKYVDNIGKENPDVTRIIWFGSWVNGLPSPGSDVDLCILLSHSKVPVRERVAWFLPFGFPVGLDLFPYTEEEYACLKERSPGMYAAIEAGRVIFSRKN
jgi:predicted nucleotidyltransferase